jgi:hypothetical protein
VEGLSGRLLAEIMAAHRDSCNARFAAARRACPMRDASRFEEHLRGPFLRLFAALADGGNPAAAAPGAVAAAAPGAVTTAARCAPVVDALYEASLDL